MKSNKIKVGIIAISALTAYTLIALFSHNPNRVDESATLSTVDETETETQAIYSEYLYVVSNDYYSEQINNRPDMHIEYEAIAEESTTEETTTVEETTTEQETTTVEETTVVETTTVETQPATKIYPEFPVMSYVWMFLKHVGYNDISASAVLGNLMVECGGWGTHDLYWWEYNSTQECYGLMQWKCYPYPKGIDVDSPQQQCVFMLGWIIGHSYSPQEANNLTTIYSLADMTTIFEERCEQSGGQVNDQRIRCAYVAYSMFAN